MAAPSENVTELLKAVRFGRKDAVNQLMNVVYADLRVVARRQMASERVDHTLQPTAVVHEAYLRMFEGSAVDWRDRAHFFAVAAKSMRQVLVDHGREWRASKRGGGLKVRLDDTIAAGAVSPCEFHVVNELLERLQKRDPQAATVIELKYFAGMSDREVSVATGKSHASIRRDWMFARAWMTKELSES